MKLERFIPRLPAPPVAVAIGGFILSAAAIDLAALALLRFALPDPGFLIVAVLPVALLAAAALMARLAGRPRRREIFAILALVATLVALAAAFRDTSWDGEAYHLPAVLALLGGWNPTRGPSGLEYLDILPSGIWTLQAQLARTLGFVEAGKILTGLFAVAALLLWSAALEALTGEAPTPARRAGLWVLAANPIALAQLTTFYLDGDVAVLAMCVAAGALLAATRYRAAGITVACAATVMLVNSKQYGIWYAAMLGLGGCLAAPLLWRERLRLVAIGAAAALFALAVVGWRPFVTSALEHGTPIYTGTFVAGRPANMEGVAPPLQFLATLFARTGGWDEEPAAAKLPFVVTPREVMFMATPDPRFGGLGPLYGLALLAALGGTAAAWRAAGGTVQGRALLGLAGAAAVAGALFPESWETRRVAVAWCIPVLLVLAWPEQERRLAWLRTAVLLALLSGSAMALGGNLARTAWRDHQLAARIERLRAAAPLVVMPGGAARFDITLAERLTRAGVAARPGGAAECGREIETYRGIGICAPPDRAGR